MSSDILIIRAKPNSPGENVDDRTYIEPQYRKAGEWFDIKNFSVMPFSLKGIEIYTLEYEKDGPNWKKVFIFKDDEKIKGRKVIRIHSGPPVPLEEMESDDRGVIEHNFVKVPIIDKHYFMGDGYILSNSQMDKIAIYDSIQKKWLDEVYYDKFPSKDVILEREENKLIEMESKEIDY